MPRPKPDAYFVEAGARILDVLELFGGFDEVRLADVSSRLGLTKSTAFRFLYTLERKNYIERTPGGRSYRRRRGKRIGLSSMSASIPFVTQVELGIAAECARHGLDLIVRHHEFDGERLVRDVEELLDLGISLLLCYNPDEHLSHIIADRCARAGVPVVAITFPVPGAQTFGVNNYRAGLSGGEGLGEHISRRWAGKLDRAVILDIPGSSPAQQARITGMLEGLRKHLTLPASKVIHLKADRQEKTASALMHEVLRNRPEARHLAVLCYNDQNALGAALAAREANRIENVLVLSQGGVAEVREHFSKRRTAMWGAVAHFPERFGEKLIPLVLQILRGESGPATTYMDHVLLTRANVKKFYSG